MRVCDNQPVFRCCGKRGDGGVCQRFVRLNEDCEDIFPSGYTIRDQALMLWHWVSEMEEPGPEGVAKVFGVWPRAVRSRFDRWRSLRRLHGEGE